MKTLLAMGVVILLALLVLRYLLPRLQGIRSSRDSTIKVVERFVLEPRKVLYIVEVERRKILIGVSDHQVNKIMDLDHQQS